MADRGSRITDGHASFKLFFPLPLANSKFPLLRRHFWRFLVKRSFLLPLVLVSLVAACQPGADGPSPSDANNPASGGPPKRLRIAVIPKGTTHEFWKSVHYGAEEAARLHGVDVIWRGSLQESDRSGQINVVQNFVTQKVDGICLAPLASQALVAPVTEARDSGIPVVIFDSGLDDDSIIVSYVATDNFRGGQLAAEELARQLNEKGDVILLRYTPGSESTHQREEGFLAKIKDYPDIRVLTSDQYSGTTRESSHDKAQQLLNKYRDEVDGIFAVCEPNAIGTLGALEDLGLAGKIRFIGFDPSERMVQALADGRMHGIVLQDPVMMGYTAVETMVKHLRGEPVERRISTGEEIATRENMNDERIAKLLRPAQYGE
jgi:ribose transport system substrate-binding protein